MKLSEKIENCEFQPEVYAYPTARCYKRLEGFSITQPEFTNEINVYLHIPFCRQLCTFCGYLKTLNSEELRKEYVSALKREIEMYAGILGAKKVISLNIGGGTPSLLQPNELGEIIDTLKKANRNMLGTAKEVSIEATPESVEYDKFMEYKALGINRVSIGIESFADSEIKMSGRHNAGNISSDAIKTLKEIRFDNVVCDLMIGIEGQTTKTFSDSVDTLLDLDPDTVEIYALGVIPSTVIGKRRPEGLMGNRQKYECYEIARKKFLEKGYLQSCHNRYSKLKDGGYVQEDTIFRGTSLIGMGAGARSYAQNIHYRNPSDSLDGRVAISRYISKINSDGLAVETGIFLSEDERMRRYAIGNIESLDLYKFGSLFGVKFGVAFPELYTEMLWSGCAYETSNELKLTPKGLLFRDLIARQFFSGNVEALESVYRATA
ncbi:MAG: coproporphyrinogen III oxidase family protein [Candidatus Micrarchaeales archaeon]|nr:coproporphyrinogen III oxidase family protein [Candidatus Micrarchaeales archaeon]